ncbi:hypothetical protein SAMN04515679_1802 [Pelosinus fermentans]|uniref:Uncharacterized protein n=2 Tax=Sporomusaceae TaxID=1843490 RepID=I9LJW3_9FIRM|nr:hypothetical protein FB4_1928 [Pelosinus fermentans B4]EIW25439.1 hypothetical protein FA11_2598 [Pelosinus fermentans A11]OAM93699.1 hypothetical protein FR7_01716 [Pelosinus fermentans DSM 17108]SDQ87006.1 hypothetical protein SAMN04515679_1802 [Pelosinus fermentans]
MKRQCKLLSEALSNEELIDFLNDYKVEDTPPDPLPDDYIPTATYNIRKSIYDALCSAITVVDQSFSRGGVSYTKADLFKLRRQYMTVGVVGCVRN